VLYEQNSVYLNNFLEIVIRKLFVYVFILCSLSVYSQGAGMVVDSFLEYPSSAHVAALGGHNVSYVGNDPMFSINNPASLTTSVDNLLYLNYSIYLANSGYGSALYSTKFSDVDAFSGSFQFAQYGKMDGYDENGVETGSFSAQEFALNATYSRQLNKYFTIGVTFKPIISTYETYTSFALGADLGVMFSDTTHLVSAGLSVTNVGGRVYGPEDIHLTSDLLPINVSVGVSKSFSKAPIALHLTLQNLQKWDYDYATNSLVDGAGKVSLGEAFARKIILGIDIVPKSKKFWVSIAYNFERGLALANDDIFSVAGLTGGVGFKIKMFSLGGAVAVYNSAGITGHISMAVDINGFNKKNSL
jgi:hypothetical protein